MNEKNVDILIDTIPYIPDIYTKNIKYDKKDNIDIENSVQTSKCIFIINLSADLINKTFYNDPNYMLYGVKSSSEEYLLPPIAFFYDNPSSVNGNYIYPNGPENDINYGCPDNAQT